jgi:hypothetical protein
MLLTKGITDYMTTSVDAELSGRGQVWLTVYCNKTGLLNTLARRDMCTAEQFEDFVLGFNQASPLFSIVDVGNIKEAADTKIKGGLFAMNEYKCLDLFISYQSVFGFSPVFLRLQECSLEVRAPADSFHRRHNYLISNRWP